MVMRRLPRSSWTALLLALAAALLTCSGAAAAVGTAHDGASRHVAAAATSATGIAEQPCHSTDDGQRAGSCHLTAAAPGVSTWPALSGRPTGVAHPVEQVEAVSGAATSTSAARGSPTLAELQLLRI